MKRRIRLIEIILTTIAVFCSMGVSCRKSVYPNIGDADKLNADWAVTLISSDKYSKLTFDGVEYFPTEGNLYYVVEIEINKYENAGKICQYIIKYDTIYLIDEENCYADRELTKKINNGNNYLDDYEISIGEKLKFKIVFDWKEVIIGISLKIDNANFVYLEKIK